MLAATVSPSSIATSLDHPLPGQQLFEYRDRPWWCQLQCFAFSFSAVTHEVSVTDFSHIHRPKHELDGPGVINAFLWAVAIKETTSNQTFVRTVTDSLLKVIPEQVVYNVNVHVRVPGEVSRGYFGGTNIPTISTIVKLWLSDNHNLRQWLRFKPRRMHSTARVYISVKIYPLLSLPVNFCPFGTWVGASR